MHCTPFLDIPPNAYGLKATRLERLRDGLDGVSIAIIWMKFNAEVRFHLWYPSHLRQGGRRSVRKPQALLYLRQQVGQGQGSQRGYLQVGVI